MKVTAENPRGREEHMSLEESPKNACVCLSFYLTQAFGQDGYATQPLSCGYGPTQVIIKIAKKTMENIWLREKRKKNYLGTNISL